MSAGVATALTMLLFLGVLIGAVRLVYAMRVPDVLAPTARGARIGVALGQLITPGALLLAFRFDSDRALVWYAIMIFGSVIGIVANVQVNRAMKAQVESLHP